jgi:trk system potassium uptake protein TrkA
MAGFEPVASASRTQRSTKLSYIPLTNGVDEVGAKTHEFPFRHFAPAAGTRIGTSNPPVGLYMRYLIVGCGRVGSTLAKLLVAEHDVTIVDENPAAFKRLGARFGGNVEVGTGIDYDVLKRAGAEKADGFVAVTDGDNRNVMASLIAQRMFRIPKIVARIYDPPRGQLYRDLGIETFSPTTLGAQIIRDALLDAPYTSMPSFDFGRLTSLVATITDGQSDRKVADIEEDGKIRITAIRQLGNVRIASPHDVLKEGDEINAIVAPDALAAFAATFSKARPAARLTA